jgi:S1-C subfamily serine protease
MSVPIDLLPAILDDLLKYGRVNKPARPWLGVYSAGVEIPIEVVRDGRSMWLRIKTADRTTFLRTPRMQ